MALSPVLFVALLSIGCGPSIDHLLAGHHDREALCASRAHPELAPRIEDALFEDLAPSIRADLVTLSQPALRVLRVRLATRAIPIDELHVALEGLESATLEAIARRTGETLPAPYVVTPGATAQIVDAVLTVVSLGAFRIDAGKRYEVYPTDAELQRAAPLAFSAKQKLQDRCALLAPGVGVRCTYHFLVPDTGSQHLSVVITESASSDTTPCSATRRWSIDLGRAEALEGELSERFGRGFVPLGR